VQAERMPGVTGENLLRVCEMRLDNVVYRLGFAATRNEARQVVKHGHVLVDGKRLDIPSVLLRPGAKLEIRESSRKMNSINAALAQVEKRPMMSWLELDKGNFAGVFKGRAVREEMNEPQIREQLVVEYYSR
jgi:small subunit ribosomal protein S4